MVSLIVHQMSYSLGSLGQPSVTNDHHLWSLHKSSLWRSPQHTLQIDLMARFMIFLFGDNHTLAPSGEYFPKYLVPILVWRTISNLMYVFGTCRLERWNDWSRVAVNLPDKTCIQVRRFQEITVGNSRRFPTTDISMSKTQSPVCLKVKLT